MANLRWSALPSGAPAQSTDITCVARSGQSYSLTVGQLLASALAALNFSALTTGTNTTAAMTVGTGASLGPAGSGVINATEIGGVAVAGTPTAGQVPVAASGIAAAWGGFPGTLTSPGYIKLPGGLIVQWGLSGSAGGSVAVSFPEAFPNACFVVLTSPTGTTSANYSWSNAVSASGFTLYNDGSGATSYWVAIGY